MKILICGLPGTGKTKLANKIAKEHNFFYISDWDIFNANGIVIENQNKNVVSKNYHQLLLSHILNIKGDVVADLEFSVSPNDFASFNTAEEVKIVYLGFYSLPVNVLCEKFKENINPNTSESKLTNKIMGYKQISFDYFQQCKKQSLPFFDVNKDRKLVLNEILEFLNIN